MRIRRLFGGNDIIMNAFWQLLIVMTVAELASSLATMIDGIILSRYLGENAIAAHGLMAPYFNLLKMLGGFFAVGTQVTCSGYIGRGNLPKACRAFNVSSIVLLVVSVSFGVAILLFSAPISLLLGAALDPEHLLDPTRYYLAGLSIGLPFTLGTIFLIPIVALNGDKARIALATNTMMIVNIVGDLANVFVLNGGMLGMALATTVSYLCSFTILLLHFRKGEGVGFKRSGLSLAVFVGVARAGTLASFTRLCSLV